jgi:hypothetical protein
MGASQNGDEALSGSRAEVAANMFLAVLLAAINALASIFGAVGTYSVMIRVLRSR